MYIIIIRTALLYAVIIAAVRFMCKRQISDLQTTELAVTMLISDIASMSAQNTSQPLLYGIIPMTVLIASEVLLSGAMIKLAPLRKLICGSPIIVISEGQIMPKALRRLRMSVDELTEALRQQNIFSFSDVLFAIVETNGKLSVFKQPEKETPTMSDLGLPADESSLEAVVISDGAFSESAMNICKTDKKSIEKILKSESLNVKDVFMMTMNRSGECSIIKRSDIE